MQTATIIILAVAVVVIAGAAFWFYQKRRTQHLTGRFGPEYDRAVTELGSRQKAESELERRAKRVDHFVIHELSPEDREQFANAWKADQARFVDEPEPAVRRAHELVTEVMRARGYPVSAEFEQNAEDLSVDHPHVVEHYRIACDIAARKQRGEGNTEDLRKAMVHYRALFDELLGVPVTPIEEVKR
jgi:FtsZ-interacting cell division protein ZipA